MRLALAALAALIAAVGGGLYWARSGKGMKPRTPSIDRGHQGQLTHHKGRSKHIRFIVIHHSATSSAERTRQVLEGRGLSTHYEVTAAGDVLEYLDPETRVAWHAKWANGEGIGIDLTHSTSAPWPEEQVQAAAELVEHLCARFGLPQVVAPAGVQYGSAADVPEGVTILRHSNVRPTRCPDGFPMERLGTVHALT